jgi:hypothetical protein
MLLERFSGNPDIERARAEFGHTQESKRPFIRIWMVSAWPKEVVDPAPLCGKSAKIMRSATSMRGRRMELYCANPGRSFSSQRLICRGSWQLARD